MWMGPPAGEQRQAAGEGYNHRRGRRIDRYVLLSGERQCREGGANAWRGVSNCRMMRLRPAPSAARIDISELRLMPLTT